MKWGLPVVFLSACLLAGIAQAEEFSFDTAEFDKKPFEFGGYLELKQERAWLNSDGALYKLNFHNRAPRDTLDRTAATLKLDGKFTRDDFIFRFRADAEVRRDALTEERINRFDEAYLSWKPDPGFTLDVGKQALKWGKGYAWNPVGFVERPKDANDVELAREGFTMVSADLIRNFDGDLKTIAFTPVLLPVSAQINSDFGQPDHLNAAAKLYLLYRDTDIDFTWLGRGSRSPRFGVDFSRNLSTALEIHGEWARIRDFELRSVSPGGTITSERRNVTSTLLGLRYLTEQDTTYILEYYRNGTGYSENQTRDFYQLIDNGLAQFQAAGTDPLLNKARQISPSYARANPGERYLYLRASQKEPFDIVYFNPSITLIANLDDRSFSLTPELLYTGVTNLDLRLRASWLSGKTGSEFGEKQNVRRLELVARYYF
ncbi:MAG: porin [Rhodocyclaceae bacterium]|nr:porin [Rhodocyclaceae bacterium]MDP3032144.1 porin [Rhodocyclaceae bacterium]